MPENFELKQSATGYNFVLYGPWKTDQNKPLNFSATPDPTPKVFLSWQEGATDQPGDGFKIYRSVNGGAYSLIATLSLSTTSYTDADVTWGNTYRYKVVEYYSDLESDPAEDGVAFGSRAETQTASDAVKKSPTRTRSESQSCADVVRKAPTRPFSRSQGASDLIPGRSLARLCYEYPQATDGDYQELSRTIEQLQTFLYGFPRRLTRAIPEAQSSDGEPFKWPVRAFVDGQPAGDAWGRQVVWVREPEELQTFAFAVAKSLARVTREELAVPSERVTRGLLRELRDGQELEAVTGPRELSRLLHDEAHAAYARQVGLSRLLFEYALLEDGDYRNIHRPIWLWGTASDRSTRAVTTFREELAAVGYLITRGLSGRVIPEEQVLADAVSKWPARRLWEWAAPAEGWLDRAVNKLVAEVAEAVAAMGPRGLTRLLEAVAAATDGDYQHVGREFAEMLSAIDSLERLIIKTINAGQVTEDVYVRGLAREIAFMAVLLGEPTRALARDFAELAGATDSVGRGLSSEWSEVATAADFLWRALVRGVAAGQNVVDVPRRRIAREAEEALVAAATPNRQVEWRRVVDLLQRTGGGPAVAGGQTSYPWDLEPYDAKVILEVLSRLVRLEDI